MEVYVLQAFTISGGMPTYQLFMCPMSLTRFLATIKVEDAQHKKSLGKITQNEITAEAKCDSMAPTIDKMLVKIWIDGEEVAILMKQEIKEYFEADKYVV